MAEFPTPTISGSSSNGRTSRLQRENARSIRVDSNGAVVQREDTAFATRECVFDSRRFHNRGDTRFDILVLQHSISKIRPNTEMRNAGGAKVSIPWPRGHRPTGGHQAGSLGMRVRFPLVPLHGQRAGRGSVSKTNLAEFESLVACSWKANVGGPRPGRKPERAARLGFRVTRFPLWKTNSIGFERCLESRWGLRAWGSCPPSSALEGESAGGWASFENCACPRGHGNRDSRLPLCS